jgi:LmbE family N-acetylglucosaminyl deacetylase
VTWGPDGGYGHPDHRLVSAAVTQVVQSRKSPMRLFYVGFSLEEVELLDDVDPGAHWHATDPNYLSVRIPVTKRDQTAPVHSLECHKSQFSPEDMKKLGAVVESE